MQMAKPNFSEQMEPAVKAKVFLLVDRGTTYSHIQSVTGEIENVAKVKFIIISMMKHQYPNNL